MTKRELAFKWITYALCTLLLLFLRALLLGNWRLWGVLPFLPPIILACVVSLEESTPATIFGLVFGVCCDLFFHAPFPCLYTVSFTLAAMTALLFLRTRNACVLSSSGLLSTFCPDPPILYDLTP